MGGGELPLKSLLVAATGIDRRQTIYNFENVLQAMNNQTDPPPILSEDVVRMTNEPSAAHDSHAEAAKKANANGFQSPMQIMRAKKRRRVEREKEKVQTVKLDAASRFRSGKTINPFSKSSTYTRRLNQRQGRNANSSSTSNASGSNRSSSNSRANNSNNSRNGGNRPHMNKKQAEAQQELMAKRQRQLQGIIAHAAKKAGMDKPALQEVARLNPELKKEIPQIVQKSQKNKNPIGETIHNIAQLLIKAARRHNIRLSR